MPACRIDHVTVTAPTLESGADYVARALGVTPAPGGAHPRMGTHNLLLRLGESTFLEVIAPDPAAAQPPRPRWFALDDPAANAAPRLAAWVARTDDLRAWPAGLLAQLGAIETMTRGRRTWLITIPADGALPLGGAAPALLEWQVPATPAALDLPQAGCELERLVVRAGGPVLERVAALVDSLGLRDAVDVLPAIGSSSQPSLAARIATPLGLRVLGDAALDGVA